MSPDTVTEVTSQSWFSRIGDSFKGIIGGILLILIAVVLLFWNEGRAVKRYKTLQEGRGAVVSVSVTTVDPANEGKLIHVTGTAETDATLTDPIFGISVNAVKLRRSVEMYQWEESEVGRIRKQYNKEKAGRQ